MIRLSQAGWALAAVALSLYAASFTSQSSFLLLLVGLLLGCFLNDLWSAQRVCRRLQVVAPKRRRVMAEETLAANWKIRNRGRKPAQWISIWAGRGQNPNPLSVIDEAPPGEEKLFQICWRFPRRGVYPLSGARLKARGRFGLVEWERRLNLEGEVRVYPRCYPAAAPQARGLRPVVGGRIRGQSSAAAAGEFAGVRPFQEGDNWRHIHWKSSSKGRGWMIKQFEEQLAGGCRMALLATRDDKVEMVEWTARAFASLALAAAHAGHRVDWVLGGMDRAARLDPFSDGEALLDALAQWQPPAAIDGLKIQRLFQNSGRAVPIHWVCARPAWRDRLMRASRERADKIGLSIFYAPAPAELEAADDTPPDFFFSANRLWKNQSAPLTF